jgi:hypothetical protein
LYTNAILLVEHDGEQKGVKRGSKHALVGGTAEHQGEASLSPCVCLQRLASQTHLGHNHPGKLYTYALLLVEHDGETEKGKEGQ